jgi:CheY-like chemotaxis protein
MFVPGTGQFDVGSQVLQRWLLPFVVPGDGPWGLAIDDQGRGLFRASDTANLGTLIGRLDTTTGTVTVWTVPTSIADNFGGPIVALPGGSVFFNAPGAPFGVVVLDTNTGVFTSWATTAQPALAIATDGAGNLFFQEESSFQAIARLVPATGRLTEWITPGAVLDDLTFAFGRLFFGSITPTGVNLRVLVVDDEPDTRDMVAEVASRCGCVVATAASIGEALDLVSAFRPDGILSDVGMPGEDGYELVRRLRQRAPSAGGRIPAAALTAYARAEDRRKAMRAGFEMHLPKPVEPAELVAAVATLARIGAAMK